MSVDPDTGLPGNEAFDRWCFTAMDKRFKMPDGHHLPVLTTVLHKVCGNDPKRFTEALRAMQLAFEAGVAAGNKGDA